MSETSQSLIRALALAAFTAIFAGMWNNDRPTDPTLALRLPADQRSFVCQHVSTAPVFKLSGSPKTAKSVAKTTPLIPGKTVEVSAPPTQTVGMQQPRTISIEADGLMIPQAELTQHMNQLSLGIAAGDYRIVDSLGGVGWLHVVDGSQMSFTSTAAEMLITEIGDSIVRFIPVQHARSASLKAVIAH